MKYDALNRRSSDNAGFEPIISIEGVSKGYGDVLVLENLDLVIGKGEFITLIGLSGCGKTTLLKMINALLAPDEGKVYVEGRDITTVDQIELRRSIGYVIQNVGLFPHMTVRKNIEYVPSLFKKYPDCVIAPEELMEIVSLDPSLLSRFPKELSGGQKQRVGIARALAVSPRIMLMDEPFGSVDEITRKHLQGAIRDIHGRLGITIVFVTHDIEEALKLGSRVVILNDKGIARCGSPDDIRRNPGSEFVAKLIGQA